MPDRMPEDMPEDMPDKMPEDLPVTKRINVMVGITRSKVFFLWITDLGFAMVVAISIRSGGTLWVYMVFVNHLRFIRRGRASKQRATLDLDDDRRDDEYEEIASDVDTNELKEWLATQPNSHQSLLLPGQTVVRKYLPPGTVMDLYEHYKSTQQMLGGYTASTLVGQKV